ADADYLLKIEHEDLAVADLAGVRRFLDRVDRLLEHLGFDGRLDLYLRQEIDHVLRAAIELGVPLLPTEALHFGHRDALHADRRQRFAHFVELEGLDDRRYEFHAGLLWAAKPAARLASECFADGKHGRGSPGVPRLGARRVKEAIGLQRVDADPRAGTLGVGAYDRRTEHPAGQILRDAHLV